MNEVTKILKAVDAGDPKAAGELLPLVYEELRKLATQKLAREPLGQTLQPTALVHEAYLRLVGAEDDSRWENRGHFFAAAAESMRRILVDQARRKQRLKHGGDRKRLDLIEALAPTEDDRLLALDEVLTQLAEVDPQAAKVVELRQFTGLGNAEIASILGITAYRVQQKWSYGRACLSAKLKPE